MRRLAYPALERLGPVLTEDACVPEAAVPEILAHPPDRGGARHQHRTVTGEHGVGTLKRDGLSRELSPEVLALHSSVKQALDPHGVLNPGKVVPPVP
ncbi:FAD-binding oxidoreductase [Lentzea sp. NPDC055074]